MPVVTDPRQPVVYDMMLLAHALVRLRDFERAKVGRHDPQFCDKQTFFENALTKIRSLAQFLSAPRASDLISVEDPEFGGTADSRFQRSHFDTVSKYLSHLHEQRFKKEARYPRPTAETALTAGREILDVLKPLMDSLRGHFTSDAARWYARFEENFQRLEWHKGCNHL